MRLTGVWTFVCESLYGLSILSIARGVGKSQMLEPPAGNALSTRAKDTGRENNSPPRITTTKLCISNANTDNRSTGHILAGCIVRRSDRSLIVPFQKICIF